MDVSESFADFFFRASKSRFRSGALKLGSVRYVEGCKKDVFYNLIVALKTQIIALVALGNNK